jgi:hypothetical protein
MFFSWSYDWEWLQIHKWKIYQFGSTFSEHEPAQIGSLLPLISIGMHFSLAYYLCNTLRGVLSLFQSFQVSENYRQPTLIMNILACCSVVAMLASLKMEEIHVHTNKGFLVI